MVTIRSYCLYLDRFARRRRLHDNGPRGEVEGNPKYVGVLDVEQGFVVQVIGLAAQGASYYLLTEQLGPECPYAENVGDGACIPTLREHGDRNDAADGLP